MAKDFGITTLKYGRIVEFELHQGYSESVYSFNRNEALPVVAEGQHYILWSDGYSAPNAIKCEVTELKITGNVVDRIAFREGNLTYVLANPERDTRGYLKYTLETIQHN